MENSWSNKTKEETMMIIIPVDLTIGGDFIKLTAARTIATKHAIKTTIETLKLLCKNAGRYER